MSFFFLMETSRNASNIFIITLYWHQCVYILPTIKSYIIKLLVWLISNFSSRLIIRRWKQFSLGTSYRHCFWVRCRDWVLQTVTVVNQLWQTDSYVDQCPCLWFSLTDIVCRSAERNTGNGFCSGLWSVLLQWTLGGMCKNESTK